MLLEDIPYEFKELNIFEEPGASVLKKINPINQIPVLDDNGTVIWDSRQIFNYINSQHQLQKMDWEQENLLTAIDGAMNAGVSLLLMHRSGIDKTSDIMYVKRQRERIYLILDFLQEQIAQKNIGATWNFHTMSIYAFLDWAQFREIVDIKDRKILLDLFQTYCNKEIVLKTKIEI